MRIIAGKYRSRVLAAPRGMATRPTSDRLRETLFNVLAPRIQSSPDGAAFLDLYAGSGAVGLEALSRGAHSVTFVERAPVALEALRTNLAALGVERAAFRVHAGSVSAYLRSAEDAGVKSEKNAVKFSVVYLDPPYDAAEEYEKTLGGLGDWSPRSPGARDLGHPHPVTHSFPHPLPHSFLSADAIVVAEHRRKEKLADRYGALGRTRLLEQGDAALSFYAVSD
jgi:16S rRNA (guanine(966)-N(2))-methyltransferase RsmD